MKGKGIVKKPVHGVKTGGTAGGAVGLRINVEVTLTSHTPKASWVLVFVTTLRKRAYQDDISRLKVQLGLDVGNAVNRARWCRLDKTCIRPYPLADSKDVGTGV
jgi:hypothetical protein